MQMFHLRIVMSFYTSFIIRLIRPTLNLTILYILVSFSLMAHQSNYTYESALRFSLFSYKSLMTATGHYKLDEQMGENKTIHKERTKPAVEMNIYYFHCVNNSLTLTITNK